MVSGIGLVKKGIAIYLLAAILPGAITSLGNATGGCQGGSVNCTQQDSTWQTGATTLWNLLAIVVIAGIAIDLFVG